MSVPLWIIGLVCVQEAMRRGALVVLGQMASEDDPGSTIAAALDMLVEGNLN